jgi:hypothetical protein
LKDVRPGGAEISNFKIQNPEKLQAPSFKLEQARLARPRIP